MSGKPINFKEVMIELLGCFTINFIVSSARVFLKTTTSISSLNFFLNYGFITAVFILLTYPQTRCHFSPVLTLSAIVFQNLDIKQGFLLIFAQFIAFLFSTSFIVLTLTQNQITLLTKNNSYLGFPHLGKNFNSVNGFFAELIFTTLYVYVFLYYSKKRDNI